MHYYRFDIGDYRRDTAHLTPIEHYIHRSLIDWYYLDEKPIPKETQVVSRRLSLGIEFNESITNVLNDFYVLHEDGWHHKRIDAALLTYQSNNGKNKVNGKLGGRPKKTHPVNDGFENESEKKPNHKPLTNNDKPLTNNPTQETSTEIVENPASVCLAMKKNGVIDINPSHPTLLALIEAGATVDEFIQAAQKAAQSGKKFAYALGIVKRQREEAATLILHKGEMTAAKRSDKFDPVAFVNGENKGAEHGRTIDHE